MFKRKLRGTKKLVQLMPIWVISWNAGGPLRSTDQLRKEKDNTFGAQTLMSRGFTRWEMWPDFYDFMGEIHGEIYVLYIYIPIGSMVLVYMLAYANL